MNILKLDSFFIDKKIMNYRKINDPLYGFITITERMSYIMDTPQFKRLHNLRQLGAVT